MAHSVVAGEAGGAGGWVGGETGEAFDLLLGRWGHFGYS